MREMVLKSFSLYGNEQMIGFFPVEIADWFLFFSGSWSDIRTFLSVTSLNYLIQF